MFTVYKYVPVLVLLPGKRNILKINLEGIL